MHKNYAKKGRYPKNAPMGNLFTCRIEPARPFLHTGIDYCGLFTLKPASKPCCKTKYKCYISLFVCTATSDLSTESFIATLKRFISRRGNPAHIYSDYGTNFVGAKRLLDDEFKNFPKSKTHANLDYLPFFSRPFIFSDTLIRLWRPISADCGRQE